jgi:hypothetical protein
MRAKIMLGVLVVVLGTAFGLSALSGDPTPPCKSGINCSAGTTTLDGPIPICRPGIPCSVGK